MGEKMLEGQTEEALRALNAGLEHELEARTRQLAAADQALEACTRQLAATDEALEARTRQLAATNQALEAFLYAVTHDLSAPLRRIEGFSRMVLEDYADRIDAAGRDALERINHSSQRLGQLIRELLPLSRISVAPMQREAIDLSALAVQLLERLKREEPAREVAWTVPAGLMADGDARLLTIALEHLLSNAWKFTRRCPEPRVELGTIAHRSVRAFFVRDNGAGFDMARAEELFRPFRRLHSSQDFEGIGIGLATVQRIVQRHGGEVWAEAAPGRGATFYFTLPASRG